MRRIAKAIETELNPTQNSLRQPIRRAMIDVSGRQLAEVVDLGLQAKQAHWNVKGPHFFSLHELFDQVAQRLEEFTDDIEERAVELGGTAQGTVQVIAKRSKLPEYPPNASPGREHVAALSGALALLGASTRAAIDIASKTGDADTADLFTGVSRGVDKLLWFVEAHAQSED